MNNDVQKWKDAVRRYADYDLEVTETSYVKHTLCDVCGLSRQDIEEIGYGFIFKEED